MPHLRFFDCKLGPEQEELILECDSDNIPRIGDHIGFYDRPGESVKYSILSVEWQWTTDDETGTIEFWEVDISMVPVWYSE